MTMIDTTSEAPRQKRDSVQARKDAQERLENAQRVAKAVEEYHNSADAIDVAQEQLTTASRARLSAIRELRQCRLTIAEIGSLTGLSSSRVQALARGEADAAVSE
jgi:hypothetical protein